jgi:hypothetical protein
LRSIGGKRGRDGEGEGGRGSGREGGRGWREGHIGRGRKRERESLILLYFIVDAFFLLPHRLIGWGQIRRGVVYKPLTSLEGGTAT